MFGLFENQHFTKCVCLSLRAFTAKLWSKSAIKFEFLQCFQSSLSWSEKHWRISNKVTITVLYSWQNLARFFSTIQEWKVREHARTYLQPHNMAMGFWQCLPFSWTALRCKHCWNPIAIMGVVDTFGPYLWVSLFYCIKIWPGFLKV